LTNEDIERRFEQLEKENSALREKLEQVESTLKQQGIDPAAPLIERRITATENSGKVASRRMDKLEQTVAEDLSRIKIDGFLSAGFTTNDESGGLTQRPYQFNDGADFESDSVLGMQVTFAINEQAKVSTQLVSNGWDGWGADIGWAYLAYKVDDQLELRAGRMRHPLYLFSESLDVGYSYPLVRPPLTLYTTEISNYDGFDATYNMRWGEANHRFSAFYGSYTFEEKNVNLDANIEGDDAMGINWTSYWNDLTARLAYTHLRTEANFLQQDFNQLGDSYNIIDSSFIVPGSTTTFGDPILFNGALSETINYYTAAVAYDDGNWLSIIEIAAQDVTEGNFIGDEVLGYFTFGYHLGKWTPYVGYGREYYKNALAPDNLFARSKDRDYKMLFSGLRYDVIPGVAAKFEWNYYYDFKGTSGPFENADAFVNGDSFDAVNSYTFLIDAVF
jgi:hypothetical protein